MKTWNPVFMLAILGMMLSATGYAAENAAQGPMDPGMMEKMKTLTSPNEAHKALEAYAGKWSYTGKFQMTPETPAQDMTGTSEITMVYGGRFMKQEIEGPWMGEDFKGIGYTGYDNVKQEYVSVWIDSVGTGIMTVTGHYDPATKTLNQIGANSCPLTGEKARPGHSTWTVVDKDHTVYSSYAMGPDGKEFKAMEITYNRV